MQSSSHCRDSSYIPLGERRGKLDLARFSLDLSWARAVSDSARSRAYPSPPMSGSPPLPPRRNPEFEDRGQGGVGAPPQDVTRGWQTSQTELRENVRVAPVGPPYQQESQPTSYPPYQRVGNVSADQAQYPYQQPPQPRPPQLPMAPLPMYALRHPQPPGHFQESERYPIAEEPGYSSPKAQRKTKGHVASACVPCKRAHLRCDAQRPCSRCTSNGKEESCIDVQHKKRGRPRLRDEREPRFEGLGQSFGPQPEHLMRRPMSVFSDSPMHHSEVLNRSGPYRILKSQSGPSTVPRYLEHASAADANIFSSQVPPTPRSSGPQELPSAYLNMDMQISSANRSFCDVIGVTSLSGRKLLDIVAVGERDKVYRFQRVFEEERKDREPNYLPPIYGKAEEDRVIQSIGQSLDDNPQIRTERFDVFTFQEPSGQQKTYQVRLGLAKKESTYYVVLTLVIPATPATPATPQEMYHMSSSPYPQEAGYGFRTPQQSFAPPPSMAPYPQYSTQYSEPRVHDPPVNFRQPPLLPSNSGSCSAPTPSTPSYAPSLSRMEYGQAQNPRQIPRSELPQGQVQRQSDFRLPPIHGQPGAPSVAGRGDDRSGRVDIGGLLEGSDDQRRRS